MATTPSDDRGYVDENRRRGIEILTAYFQTADRNAKPPMTPRQVYDATAKEGSDALGELFSGLLVIAGDAISDLAHASEQTPEDILQDYGQRAAR